MLGPARTIAQLSRRSGCKVSAAKLYDLAHDGWWQARAAYWDDHLEAKRVEAIEVAIEEDAKAVAKRHGRLLRTLARFTEREAEKYENESAKFDMPSLSPRELIRYADTTIKLERLLMGEVTERVETQPNLDNLSLDELRTMKALQEKAGVRQ